MPTLTPKEKRCLPARYDLGCEVYLQGSYSSPGEDSPMSVQEGDLCALAHSLEEIQRDRESRLAEEREFQLKTE